MNKLVIGSVFALVATQAAGCVIEEDATVGATWSIVTIDGANLPCPPDGTTAALFNVAVDASGTPLAPCTGPASVSNTCFVDLFNCEDHSGVSSPLPPAMYQTWVSLTDDTGTAVHAQSLSAYLDVTDVDLDFHTSIVENGGYFALDWTLKGATSNAALSCSQAGATGVETIVTVAGGTAMVDAGDPWNCEDHYGVTAALPVGSYTVSVDAFSSAGALGDATNFASKPIYGPNKVTDLGTAMLSIDNM